MAEGIRGRFASWTERVAKEITPGGVYGVGVNLTIVQPAPGSSSKSSKKPVYNRIGVDSVHPDGPAGKAGLQKGDVVLEVDGRNFGRGDRPYLPDDVASAIRGPEGTDVKVVVERKGERVELTMTREPIAVTPPVSPLRKMLQKPERPPIAPQKEETQSKKKGQESQNEVEGKPEKVDGSGKKKKADTSCERQTKKKDHGTKTKTKKEDEQINKELESLTFEEEEHKEKDLASSREDADQFDAEVPVHRGRLLTGDDISEEKSNADEVSSVMNSVGSDSQWELISERSGSAILLSLNGSISGCGSFRSVSPSVLKNKFVLTESTGDAYIEHVVLPTDTLQGLCLAYKTSVTKLRMANGFSGNTLQMAPKKLRIPNDKAPKGMMVRTQDKTSTEYKLYAFVAEMPEMEMVEAKAYLDLSNWDLEEALRSAREDEGWNLKGGGGFDVGPIPPSVGAVAKPKALTARDIYYAPPAFEGDGFELKDIKRG
ncbi:hypothetical protein ACHAXT_003896 [Thalassiosira profunda]